MSHDELISKPMQLENSHGSESWSVGWKQLKECAKSRDVAVKDDRAAARVQATRVLAGTEQREAQARLSDKGAIAV